MEWLQRNNYYYGLHKTKWMIHKNQINGGSCSTFRDKRFSWSVASTGTLDIVIQYVCPSHPPPQHYEKLHVSSTFFHFIQSSICIKRLKGQTYYEFLYFNISHFLALLVFFTFIFKLLKFFSSFYLITLFYYIFLCFKFSKACILLRKTWFSQQYSTFCTFL